MKFCSKNKSSNLEIVDKVHRKSIFTSVLQSNSRNPPSDRLKLPLGSCRFWVSKTRWYLRPVFDFGSHFWSHWIYVRTEVSSYLDLILLDLLSLLGNSCCCRPTHTRTLAHTHADTHKLTSFPLNKRDVSLRYQDVVNALKDSELQQEINCRAQSHRLQKTEKHIGKLQKTMEALHGTIMKKEKTIHWWDGCICLSAYAREKKLYHSFLSVQIDCMYLGPH